ncbi:MAG: endonuclease/exonuclease/phosphatase family protein [Bacteroidales bacterium]|nr:endonuclease/exonuclease/phosphatase family protein [Bacteroidales bacterium]HOY38446.1 endonuclease [Bacteroidales bacterium]HQP04166.1 endonuclease [Bacteroidales bacterium]
MSKLLFVISIVISIAVISCRNGTKEIAVSDAYNEFSKTEADRFRFMFYNVENLFDIYNDSLKNDDEFLPDQAKYWTASKYYTKLNHIYQVIVAVGEWELPDIIGLSEIENRIVLEQLIEKTPLYKTKYKIIHYESPDPRGIDVALLYKPSSFKPLYSEPIRIVFPGSTSGGTRDILYVKGIINNNDTLHIFINHWPSRWGGQMETEDKRMHCATVVHHKTDSILKANPNSNIIISGDLNDYPTDKSLQECLKAQSSLEKIENKKLYNLSYYLQETKHLGTHKHDGHWGVLDQIIVSGALLNGTGGLITSTENIFILDKPFILEEDEKNTGLQPFRTYAGYKYLGGFSDHLPTYIDLKKNKPQ